MAANGTRKAVVTGAASGIGEAVGAPASGRGRFGGRLRRQRRGHLVPACGYRSFDARGRRHRQPVLELGEAGQHTEAAVYASSKAAVLSITRSFAYVFAPRQIRVNAICPGIVDMPMQDRVLEESPHSAG